MNAHSDFPVNRVDRSMAIGVFFVAMLIATLFTQGRLSIEKLGEEPKVGIHLAKGEGFRTPMDASPTAELTAWVPPAYPIVTAAVFRMFGIESRVSFRILIEINAICYGLMVCGVFVIGQMLMSRWAGLLGALLVIADPLFLLLIHRIWDTYFAQAGLVWLTVAALRASRAEPKWIWLAGIGAGLGILVQFNGSFIFVAPVLGWMAVRYTPIRRWIPLAAVAGVMFTIMLVPWTVRNYLQFHQLMYVRRGAELEMYLGNMPQSTGWQDLRYHPMVYPPEHALMISMGEAKYFAYCKQRFMENYHTDPAAYWRRTARRVLLLVIGEPSSRPMEWASAGAWVGQARLVSDVLIFALGAAGLMLAYRLGYRTGWIVPLSLASTVPYVISHINYRFSMQVKLFLLLMIGFLLWAIWQKIRTAAWPAPIELRNPV